MRLFLCALLVLAALPVHAADVSVAAASNLNFAIKEIIQQFERETGNRVRLTLGSSGNFYAQILNGAPFDVFPVGRCELPETAGERRACRVRFDIHLRDWRNRVVGSEELEDPY